MASIRINTPTESGFVTGRNGTADIKEIQIWTDQNQEGCYLDFVSKAKGQVLNAGGAISTKAMDELAVEWVKARGLKIK